MPTYAIEMRDGRKFHVDADQPPTEEEVMQHLRGNTRTTEQFAPATDPVGEFMSGIGKGNGPGPNSVDFLKNIGKDAMEQARGMGKAISDRVGAGAGKNFDAVGSTRPSNVVDFVKSRTKADTNPADIYNHPAAFLSDAAAVMGGAETAADIAGAAAKGMGRTAKAVGKSPVVRGTGAVLGGMVEDTPVIGGAVKGYRKYAKARDAAAAAAAPPKPKMTGTAEGLDRYMPNQSAPAPTMEDSLNDTLQGMLTKPEAPAPATGEITDESGRGLGATEPAIDPEFTGHREMRSRSQNTKAGGMGQPGATFKYVDPMSGEKFFDVPTETGPSTISHTEALKRGYAIPSADRPLDVSSEMDRVRAARDAAQARIAPQTESVVESGGGSGMDREYARQKIEQYLGEPLENFDSISDEQVQSMYDETMGEGEMEPGDLFESDVSRVPTDQIFKNPYDDSREYPTKKYQTSEVKPIPVEDIVPTQPEVSPDVMAAQAGWDEYGAAPEGIRDSRGKYHVVDGHHRLANAIRAGETSPDMYISGEADSFTGRLIHDDPAMQDVRDWHSGETPGSPEAKQASQLHKDDAEMDAIYQQLIADPRK